MKEKILLVCCVLLILLFSYTAISKLLDMGKFLHELSSQPFGKFWARILQWAIPGIELLVALMIATERFRLWGLMLALVLMFAFTVYVSLILFGVFPRRPCSCAGVIRQLGWTAHFIFNLFFTLIAFAGVVVMQKKKNASI
jgi:putative oxidoreductase